MQPKFRPFVVVIALLATTSAILAMSIDASLTDESGLVMDDGDLWLPETVADFSGEEMRFCQKSGCKKEWGMSELDGDPDLCPNCGDGELDTGHASERQQLPADTKILKSMFDSPGKRQLVAAIVLSGAERASIHRPEVCLNGQGNSIDEHRLVDVPLKDGSTIKIKILELTRTISEKEKYYSFYAYWFVGKGRHTHSHWQRMFWMASDRAVYNVAHRWAYISINGVRTGPDEEGYVEEVKAFVADLYPQIVLEDI